MQTKKKKHQFRNHQTYAIVFFNFGIYSVFFMFELNMSNLIDRITIDPAICHGKPVIRGLRYPVHTMLELLASGMTIEEIFADYADLEREDLLACLAFAAKLSDFRPLNKVA